MRKGNTASDANEAYGTCAPGKVGASMADAAVSGGAANVASLADAEGPSSPTGASVPGNIARAYEALDSFWRE